MFDFLKSLFSAKDEEILEKVASIKATGGASINKINAPSKEIDTNKADNANKLDGPLFINEQDGKYGFINTKGEQVVECEFSYADAFSEGLARVEKDGKSGYINTKGEQVIECKFDEASGFSEGLAEVAKAYESHRESRHVNTKGNFIVFDEDNNQIEAIKKVSDKSGNIFLLSNSDGKFGLLDANYNVLIKNKLYGEFEVVQRMNENTFLIKMAEKEFFIDSNGDFK